MRIPAINSSQGFTMIEFLVAIVILMVGLLALLQSVNMVIATNGSNKKRAVAVQLADRAMSSERVLVFSDLTTNGLRKVKVHQQNGTDKFEYQYLTKASYAGLAFVNYSVVDQVTTLASNTKNVKITVSWRDKGARMNHSLVSVVAQ